MNAFDIWLIIVGLAIGAGLTWLVMLDLRRRDDDIAAREMRAEAAWIADTLRQARIAADAEAVEEVLRLHRAYLAGIPDDDGSMRPLAVEEDDPAEGYLDPPIEPVEDVADGSRGVAPRPDAAPGVVSGAPDGPIEAEPIDEDDRAAHEALEALLNRGRPEERTRPED